MDTLSPTPPPHAKRRRMRQPDVECKGSDSASSLQTTSPIQRPLRPRQNLRVKKSYTNNYGSEASSDDSEDDEWVSPFIPRRYRSVLETPVDSDFNGDHAPAPSPTPDSDPEVLPPAATEQPWEINDFQWRVFPKSPIQPELRRETFSQSNAGPATPIVDPYDIFIAIWDRQFMEHIASETNRYAQQMASQVTRPHTRIGRWRDTTPDELYVYFGLVIAMGVVVKSRPDEYWSTTPDVFYTPGFGAHMSINRFNILSKCLHFRNNEDMGALDLGGAEAKLFKIQPVLSHLNMKFQSLYTPKRNISLDESLQRTKSADVRQSIPSRTATVGIKTYEISESQTGYLWRFEAHAHKSSPQSEDPSNESTASIVLRLTQGLENKGYTLWMDNFYNSPCLARRLKSLGFDCAGTLRTDRKFVPQALDSLTKKNLRPGQITGFTSGDVDVMVWRDVSRVAMISTYHGNAVKSVQGSTKPIVILDYNYMMGGLDKRDQMLVKYPIARKQTQVWYKKLFRRLLNVSIFNSYIIHRQQSTASRTHRDFRKAVVKCLLSNHSSAALLLPVSTETGRPDVTHRLAEHAFQNRQRKRRVCVVCKKRIHTLCVGCNKNVCIDPCFLTLHS